MKTKKLKKPKEFTVMLPPMSTQPIEDAFETLMKQVVECISDDEPEDGVYAKLADLECDVVNTLGSLMDRVAFLEKEAQAKSCLWECANLLCGHVFKREENRCPKCYG